MSNPQEFKEFAAMKFPDTTLVDGGLLNEGGRLIVGGETGTGKSYLALQLVAEAAMGLPWLGVWPVRKKLRSLLLQTEVAEPVFQQRALRLLEGYPEFPKGVVHQWTQREFSVVAEKSATREFCKAQSVDLVVFDPLYQMHDGDENQVHTIKPVQKAFDYIAEDRAVILCHHLRKPGEGPIGVHSLRGSSAWAGWADTVLLLLGKPGGRYIWLHVVKARNRQDALPRAYKLEWQKPGVFFKVVEEQMNSEFADIYDLVADGPRPRSELVKALQAMGRTRSPAYELVRAAERAGVLVSVEGGLTLGE